MSQNTKTNGINSLLHSSLPHQVNVGILLIMLSAPFFFWFFFINNTFYGIEDVSPLRYTFLFLGFVSSVTGIFLAAGGKTAMSLLIAIGLDSPPQIDIAQNGRRSGAEINIRILTFLLRFSALGNLIIAWMFFNIGEVFKQKSETPWVLTKLYFRVYQAIFCLIVFIVIPGILAPFCVRKKVWALLTVLLLSGIIILGTWLPWPRLFGLQVDLWKGDASMYWIGAHLVCLLAFLSLVQIFISRWR